MNNYTSFLYAQPSVLSGIARIIDLWGAMTDYNYSLTPEQADALAFLADDSALTRDTGEAVRQVLGESMAEAEA